MSVVLGPGVNIKRNPLCGRNFEYFSEDPYLAGQMAATWIEGLQSCGVGASLKHFAGNSQEDRRMASDSLIDERALREIYLPAFEAAVKDGKPATVMAAYNLLNGVYCSDNRFLLRDILRDEWGFEGVVVTDWGGLNDRVAAFEAGLDLEMPTSGGQFDADARSAVESGALAEARIDESVERILALVFGAANSRTPGFRYDPEQHHQIAKRIATGSAVLLKNDGGLLPLAREKTVALIGALAKAPRYQGAGSSRINPTRLSSALEGFDALGLRYAYFDGYPLQQRATMRWWPLPSRAAIAADVAVVFAGLPDEYESEGFDRASMAMPASHNDLISRVAAANPNTVVVLSGGAAVEMPWVTKVKAVLHMSLAGQAGGLAAAELLAGVVNPSGKLAESYPLAYADVPSAGFYETGGKQAQYRESIYVGYRYYDRARKPLLFPFGHGLSYTTFAYEDLELSASELHAPYDLRIAVTVRNTGAADGAEVVQVYVGQQGPSIFRPEQELKEFAKVFLEAGEARRLTFTLDTRSFAVWDVASGDWVVPDGVYRISVAASSRDVRLQAALHVRGVALETPRALPCWYVDPAGPPTRRTSRDFWAVESSQSTAARKGEYTLASSCEDMKGSFVVRQFVRMVERSIGKGLGGVDYADPAFRMAMAGVTTSPIRRLSQLSPARMPPNLTTGLVRLANGKILQGLSAMARKPRRSASDRTDRPDGAS